MRNWFFTTMFMAVTCMTSAIFLTCLSFFIVVKSNIKSILYKLYPQAIRKSHRQGPSQKPESKKKFSSINNSLSQANTEDLFSDIECSSEEDKRMYQE